MPRTVKIDGKKYKVIWDNKRVIGMIKKSNRMAVQVSLVAYDGVKYIHLKGFYQKKNDIEWKPTYGQSISIPIKMPIDDNIEDVCKDVISLMQQAIVESEDFDIESEQEYGQDTEEGKVIVPVK